MGNHTLSSTERVRMSGETERSMTRVVLESTIVAVLASLICVAVMKLMGTEVRPAVVGGVVGGVTAAVMMSRNRSATEKEN